MVVIEAESCLHKVQSCTNLLCDVEEDEHGLKDLLLQNAYWLSIVVHPNLIECLPIAIL